MNELKELGNAAAKDEKYEEAIVYYTHGIKIDPTNFTLYSNRSFAFLKIQQYYHALEDAKHTISLNQTWAKVCLSYLFAYYNSTTKLIIVDVNFRVILEKVKWNMPLIIMVMHISHIWRP